MTTIGQQSMEMVTVAGYGRRFVSKAIAALLCSGGLAWAIFRLMLQDAAQGREAYIAAQAAYFDDALSPANVSVAITYVVMVCLFLLLYALLSLGIYMLIRGRRTPA